LESLTAGFPQWQFEARWRSPESRGLAEPALRPPGDYNSLLLDLLGRPNICSREWIYRQYDHEVQGGSVVKPLVGIERDVPGDAAVIRPRLGSNRGLGMAQALNPAYSAIDAYHMTACTIDEAVRRLIAVGGDPDHIGGVDNFCWPNIQHHPRLNPDGDFKAAQLVRACRALRDMCLAYEVPLLSGKDSMYVDGNLPGRYGEIHKVSAPETLQFTTIGVLEDVGRCMTLDAKVPGDSVYVLGSTRDELGASEYYELFGYTGRNVPRVVPEAFLPLYRQLASAIAAECTASVHGVYRGGLGVHLALTAMAGGLGMKIHLDRVPVEGLESDDAVLFSESQGRFVVTVAPDRCETFERFFQGLACERIGEVTGDGRFEVFGRDGARSIALSVAEMKTVWKTPFGHLV
jgi:phosphoribosylformylglycinamidine synthase